MWFKLNTTFTQSLGTLSELSNSWSITRNLTNYTTTSTTTSVTKNGSYSATFTLNSGCTYSSHSVTMGGATVTSGVTLSSDKKTLTVNISKVTGAVVITAVATGASSGGSGGTTPPVNPPSGGGSEGGEPETPVNPPSGGAWLSVLLTGDADAHNKFMNGTLTGAGSLAKGRDVIYATSQIQSLLAGKKIYKIASNGLNENTLTLYSNPWKGDNSSNTTDGRTAVGTVTSTSAQAVGTIVEYSVSNPSAIKDNETLSIGWTGQASGIKTVENYNTVVYYLNPASSTTFTAKLASFCSFDFYVGE